MAIFKGKCPECGVEITPALTEAQFNRNAGLHKAKVHGYKSPASGPGSWYQRNKAKVKRQNKLKRLAKQDELLKGHYTPEAQAKDEPGTLTAQAPVVASTRSIKLDHCPLCNARFYACV